MKVAWRILCYFFLAAAAFAGREGYSQNSYVLVGMSVLVVLATGALLETVLRKP